MGLWKCIRWNIRYIRIVNSCDAKAFTEMVDEILELKGGFTRKRYIWNHIRGKTFYITIANYTANLVKDAMVESTEPDAIDIISKVHRIIDAVLDSESDETIRRDFVRNVTKKVPLITTRILPYMSYERVVNILSGIQVLHDDALLPVIDTIAKLRTQEHMTSDVNEGYDY